MTRIIGILGGGESGVGAAILARQQGYEVWLSELKKIRDPYRDELINNKVHFEEGGHDFDRLAKAEIIVKSPGIPDSSPVIQRLKEAGNEIVSEIEFGYRHMSAPVIAITGSNGKTTTTHLVYHLLKDDGAVMAGNVGRSFCRAIAEESAPDWYVLELSSFQIDGTVLFRPRIGMLLNISPDHLDRYNSFEAYAESKLGLGRNMADEDVFIYNESDPEITGRRHLMPDCRLIGVDVREVERRQIDIEGENFQWDQLKILGKHNRLNALFAIRAVEYTGLHPSHLGEKLKTFRAPSHRLEYVRTVGGARFYNDSKATNVDSVFYALEALEKPIVWIAGGQDKGNDYSRIKPLVRDKVKTLICLGADNARLIREFKGMDINIVDTHNMKDAVREALKASEPDSNVLLSPACASFDLFRNFEERGDLFKQYVKEL